MATQAISVPFDMLTGRNSQSKLLLNNNIGFYMVKYIAQHSSNAIILGNKMACLEAPFITKSFNILNKSII
jgi:hypothetical protein